MGKFGERLYVKDLFFNFKSNDKNRNEKTIENSTIDTKWKESKLHTINEFIKDSKIMDNIDLLFIDTAPFHINANGTRDLVEECKVWLGSFISDKISHDIDIKNSLSIELLKDRKSVV